MFFQACSLFFLPVIYSASTHVNYGASNHDLAWGSAYCNGVQNSPINLEDATSQHYTEDEADIDAYNVIACIRDALNDETSQLKINYDDDSGWENQQALKFTFVPEPTCLGLKVAQYHYHFDDSEHTIDGKHSFGEVHYVTYKDNFADLTAAVVDNSTGNLAVFGFMLDVNSRATVDNSDETAAFQANLDAFTADQDLLK